MTADPGVPQPADPQVEVRVLDIKQFVYCPRIVYFQRVLCLPRLPTERMGAGLALEDALLRLEKRRKLHRYGLASAERHMRLPLHSAAMRLSGQVDLVLATPASCHPVDFKHTSGGVRLNHRIQLAAYALLLEERLGLPVTSGFVVTGPDCQVHRVVLDQPVRDRCMADLSRVRDLLHRQNLPPPTTTRSKCRNCEYLLFCGDRL